MKGWSALAFALLSCRREAPPKPDPAVVDAAPPVPTARVPFVLRQGRVIDPRTATVVHVLRAEDPRSEAHDGVHAVLLDRADTVHVYELASGRETWSFTHKGLYHQVAAVAGQAVVTSLAESLLLDLTKQTKLSMAASSLSHPVATSTELFAIQEPDKLQRIDRATTKLVPLATPPFALLASWHSTLKPLADGRTVCAVAANLLLDIACYDPTGKLVSRATVDLHRPTDPKGTHFAIRKVDQRYVLYGTGPLGVGVRRSVVVRLADGVTVAAVEDEVATTAIREDGTLAGLVVVRPEVRYLDASGTLRWTRPAVNPHDDSASALVREGRLFLDVFPEFSSGSSLLAFDEKTGSTLWTGDVERLPIGHSEYFNEVELRFGGPYVWLRGDEAALRTIQAFDEKTGRRALSVSSMGGAFGSK